MLGHRSNRAALCMCRTCCCTPSAPRCPALQEDERALRKLLSKARSQAAAADPHAAAGAVEAEKSQIKAILSKYQLSDAELEGELSNAGVGAAGGVGCRDGAPATCACRQGVVAPACGLSLSPASSAPAPQL